MQTVVKTIKHTTYDNKRTCIQLQKQADIKGSSEMYKVVKLATHAILDTKQLSITAISLCSPNFRKLELLSKSTKGELIDTSALFDFRVNLVISYILID